MQKTFGFNSNWSKPILTKEGWDSTGELFEKLGSIQETVFTLNGIPGKAVFISGLKKLIVSIEMDGDSVKEAKQMTSPGSLFESLNSDYLFIRNRYLQKRRKLKEQLRLVKDCLQFKFN